jgi:REP element-mobilizing transposase RayT
MGWRLLTRDAGAMGYAALRQGRCSLEGQIYLVTFTTMQRKRLFDDWNVATDAARIMSAAWVWQRSRLLAWVVMPDHWHGLVELGGFDTLPACMHRLKGRSARLLRQAHPGLGPVWADGYHDRAVRSEERLVDAARYVVMNPVRAGLVQRVGSYPFWNAVWL